MKSAALLICFLSAMFLASCESVAIRPVYEYAEIEVEFDGNVLVPIFIPVPDFDQDINFTRAGVEAAITTEAGIELFTDVNWAEADNEDDGDIDGYEVGIGARSQWPDKPGWGEDWSARISYFEMDEDDTFGGFDVDDEVEGYGITLKGGPYYGVEVGEEYILSPHAGLFYSMKRGEEEFKAAGIKVADFDFDYDSFGVYAGARFNRKSLKNFDLAADLFVGSSDLVGVMLSAGIRF